MNDLIKPPLTVKCTLEPGSGVWGYEIHDAQTLVAQVGEFETERGGSSEAYANLFAAAPELYTALKEARRWWTSGPPGVMEAMNAALAKAEGKSP